MLLTGDRLYISIYSGSWVPNLLLNLLTGEIQTHIFQLLGKYPNYQAIGWIDYAFYIKQ